jgi:hypothetical protein
VPLLLSVDNQHSEGPLLLTVSGIEAYLVKRAGQTGWLLQRLGSAASTGHARSDVREPSGPTIRE